MTHLNTQTCIGGPLDRQQTDTGAGHASFEFAIEPSERHTYHRRDIATENVVFGVWVHETLSPDEAVQRLLENYVGRVG